MIIPEIICAVLLIISGVILIINMLNNIINKDGSTDRDRTLFLVLLGAYFLFVIVLAYRYSDEIKLAEFFQILLMFGLVTVTIVYARSASRQASASRKMAEATKEQADANAKMATEMQNQRYDAFRPVIDIDRSNSEPRELAKEAYKAKNGELPEDLMCLFRNIGVGPAIDVLSYVPYRERRLHSFGTIATKGTDLYPIRLSLEGNNNRKILIVYYKDVYGRCFESSREVSVDKDKGAWKLGPLAAHKIDKEVYSKLFKKL